MAKADSETYLKVILPMSGGYQEITNLFVTGVDNYTVTYRNIPRHVNRAIRIPSGREYLFPLI